MKSQVAALGRNNVRLLWVMLVAALAAFCYFPYVTTALAEYLGLRSPDMATLAGLGMVAGNVLAYVASLRIACGAAFRLLRAGYAMLLGALVVMACAKAGTGAATLLMAGASLVLYRFAMALTSNLVRTAQMQLLPDRSAKPSLFSYIKLVTSIGGACGPVLGSLAFAAAGMPAVLMLSGALFACALGLLCRVRAPLQVQAPMARPATSLGTRVRAQPRRVILLSSAGMLHYVFEAQIYTAIAITLQRNVADFTPLVALLFTGNALLLVVLVVPVLRVCSAWGARHALLAGATLLSCLAAVLAPFIAGPWSVLGVCLLFTLGEIVTPQLLVDMVTDVATDDMAADALATYNLFTSGAGLGLGYWIGGWIAAADSALLGAVVWGVIYLAYVATLLACRAGERARRANSMPRDSHSQQPP